MGNCAGDRGCKNQKEKGRETMDREHKMIHGREETGGTLCEQKSKWSLHGRNCHPM